MSPHDGTAAWRFGGWPQNKIPMHAKTGTAEVAGKQTTSWFATYTKDYTVVMTISQGGTGSGASGPAVRNIYNALYGVAGKGKIDEKKALLPEPEKDLPKIDSDGQIQAQKDEKLAARATKRDGDGVRRRRRERRVSTHSYPLGKLRPAAPFRLDAG